MSQGVVRKPGKRVSVSGALNDAGFYSALLDALPSAAAYVTAGGRVLLSNQELLCLCADQNAPCPPGHLPALLSDTSWRRCETVLSAAISGLPVKSSGTLEFKSGKVLCSHMVCTHLTLLEPDEPVVLVQFETETGISGLDYEEPRSDTRECTDLELASFILRYFPDEVFVFQPDQSMEDCSRQILGKVKTPCRIADLAELLREHQSAENQVLYIPQGSDTGGSDTIPGQKMCEIRLVTLSGRSDADGRPWLAIVRENVDCPHEAAENRQLAFQDSLTGLANRRAFTNALDREMLRLEADGSSGLAVLYIDLDEFKKVNDFGGHDVGDDMLRRVAVSLASTLGEFGIAARIGGDEFAGMLPVADKQSAEKVAEEVLQAFARIRLEVADRVFTIGGSIGVAYVPDWSALDSCDADGLLVLADRASLRTKRCGGQAVQVHRVEPGDGCVQAPQIGTLEPGNIEDHELALFAMPIVCLQHDEVYGSEILLRLQGEQAQGLSPKAWISAVERSGFIARVDAWTLNKVLDAAERSAARTLLTMNVSVDSARDPGFRDCLYNRLSLNPAQAARLCLEVSEKDLLREPATVEYFFRFASELGCQTAIDDFAGHWPVLSRLVSARVDWLKLDAEVSGDVTVHPEKIKLLKGLVSCAQDLGFKFMAKHVETAAETDLLRGIGIEAAQGYYFGKPAPWPAQ